MPIQIWGWLNAQGMATVFAGILAGCAVLLFLINAVRLATIDVRTHRLPNRIMGPWFLATLGLLGGASLLAGEPGLLVRMLLGGALLFAGYLALHLAAPGGMGMGDVKLAAIIGLYLGFMSWSHLLMATMVAFIAGAAWSSLLLVTKRATLRTSVAFGPFMLLGAAVSLAFAA